MKMNIAITTTVLVSFVTLYSLILNYDTIIGEEIMSMAITFDTLKFAKRLESAGVEPKIAEAHAEAEAEVFAETFTNQVATKHDITRLEAKMEQIENRLIIKLGGIVVAVGGMLGALNVIFHIVG